MLFLLLACLPHTKERKHPRILHSPPPSNMIKLPPSFQRVGLLQDFQAQMFSSRGAASAVCDLSLRPPTAHQETHGAEGSILLSASCCLGFWVGLGLGVSWWGRGGHKAHSEFEFNKKGSNISMASPSVVFCQHVCKVHGKVSFLLNFLSPRFLIQGPQACGQTSSSTSVHCVPLWEQFFSIWSWWKNIEWAMKHKVSILSAGTNRMNLTLPYKCSLEQATGFFLSPFLHLCKGSPISTLQLLFWLKIIPEKLPVLCPLQSKSPTFYSCFYC